MYDNTYISFCFVCSFLQCQHNNWRLQHLYVHVHINVYHIHCALKTLQAMLETAKVLDCPDLNLLIFYSSCSEGNSTFPAN